MLGIGFQCSVKVTSGSGEVAFGKEIIRFPGRSRLCFNYELLFLYGSLCPLLGNINGHFKQGMARAVPSSDFVSNVGFTHLLFDKVPVNSLSMFALLIKWSML